MCGATSHPEQLGRYQVLETLAPGRMGEIFKGFDAASQRTVVLKTIAKDRLEAHGAGAFSSFQNEAKAAMALHHPGIVAVYESGEDRGLAFIATEFVPLPGLRERTRIPVADAASLLVQLLEALEYAHEHGVVHLEIQPSNLLLTEAGQLRITDFGVARLEPATPNYMSPEQFMGRPADRRSDIFSAGIIFYEMLSGVSPFGGPPQTLVNRVCDHRQKETPVSRVHASVPSSFDEVVAKALAKPVYDRYHTARAFSDHVASAFLAAFNSPVGSVVSAESVRLLTGQQSSLARESIPLSIEPSPRLDRFSWDEETLRSVEREAERFVGPLARIVVREAAARTTDLDHLFSLVAESLDSETDRAAFLTRRTYRKTGGTEKKREPHDVRPAGGPQIRAGKQASPSPSSPASLVAQPAVAGSAPVDLKKVPGGDHRPLPKAGSESKQAAAQPKSPIANILGEQPESLAAYLKDTPAQVERVIYAFSSSLGALISMDSAARKHAALLPQNIYFDPIGKATIRLPAGDNGQLDGTVMLNPRYAAPEIFGDTYSADDKMIAAAHIYALAFMFYEIMLGRGLFEKIFLHQRTDLDWLRWHSDLESKAPVARSLLPDCPAALSDLLESMMEKHVEKRAADLPALRAAFLAVAGRANRTIMLTPVTPSQDTTGLPSPPTKKADRRGINVLLLLILALVAGGGILFVIYFSHLLQLH